MVNVDFQDIVDTIKESNLSIFRFDKYLSEEQREIIKSVIEQCYAPIHNFEIFDRYFEHPDFHHSSDNLKEVVKYFEKYKHKDTPMFLYLNKFVPLDTDEYNFIMNNKIGLILCEPTFTLDLFKLYETLPTAQHEVYTATKMYINDINIIARRGFFQQNRTGAFLEKPISQKNCMKNVTSLLTLTRGTGIHIKLADILETEYDILMFPMLLNVFSDIDDIKNILETLNIKLVTLNDYRRFKMEHVDVSMDFEIEEPK